MKSLSTAGLAGPRNTAGLVALRTEIDFLPRVGVDARRWPAARLDAMFDDYLAHYEAACARTRTWSPAIRRCSTEPASARCPAGSKPSKRQRSQAGFSRYIEVVLTQARLGLAKPDPHIFLRACSQLGVPPEESVHVGDRLEVDALAAREAGLRGVWLNRTGLPTLGEIGVIGDLSALPGLVYGQAT